MSIPRLQALDFGPLTEADRLRSTRWAVDVRDVTTGAVLTEFHHHRLLRCASLGKLYLLIEVATQVVTGHLDPRRPVDRRSVAPVADSGLWQHLASDVLPVIDAAQLVGSVSDNLATNVLLELVGLETVQARAALYAADGSTLHDQVRDVRGASDPATLSEGSAADWACLFTRLYHGTVENPQASDLVLSWLSANVDLSMVASAFGLDPLAHAAATDRGMAVWNKTGTDIGIRADAGLVRDDGQVIAYAVVCNWDPHVRPDPRDAVLATMRDIGAALCIQQATT